MEKLFEVVGSLIPDEQKADVKAKFDGVLENVLKEREVEFKKELSEKYDVNLFEEDLDKAYKNKNFVRSDKFEEIVKENESYKKELEEIKPKLEELTHNESYYELGIKLVGEGVNPERIPTVKSILPKEGSVEEKVAYIKEKLPELFLKETIIKKTNPNNLNNDGKTGAELYFERELAKIKK